MLVAGNTDADEHAEVGESSPALCLGLKAGR